MADLHSFPICDWLEGSVGNSISAMEAYVGQCVAVLHGVFVCVCTVRSGTLAVLQLSLSELEKRAEGEGVKERTEGGVDCEASSIQSAH